MQKERGIERMYKRCAGLDVHQRSVMVGSRVVKDGTLAVEINGFERTGAQMLRVR